ncbi:ABC transporter substrate-binding protein [Microbacterium sp.]|uniref:ABC transporter substrate-binding protein n=1 Tax=Microbacterium sp. TaxID=51671 RepID=UPI003A8A02E8
MKSRPHAARTRRTPRAFGRLALAGAVAGAVALSGCSGTSADPGTSGEGSAAEVTSIRLVVAPIQFETAYIARDEGYFAEQGLDVEIIPGGAPQQNAAMAVSGEADIITGSWGMAITANQQGLPLKVIAGNGRSSTDVAQAAGALMVNAGSDIQTLEELRGATIGVQGLNTGSEVGLYLALQSVGIAPDDVTLIELASSAMPTAIDENTVDAVLVSNPFYQQMVAAGQRAISHPTEEFIGGGPITVWTVTDNWLTTHADVAEKFVAAMRQADAFYMDPANMDAVMDVTAEYSAVDRASLDPAGYAPMGVDINIVPATLARDSYIEFGIVDDAPPVDELLWADAPRTDS